MAYHTMIESFPIFEKTIGDFMRICKHCDSFFETRHRINPKCCSIKCHLLSKVRKQEDGCWIYIGSTSGIYGKVRWQGKWYRAHRVSYEQLVGPVETEKWVCHKCDVPKCINPEHLFLGSPSDNRKDAVRKGRTPRGENNHLSKYTDKQVDEIRQLKKEGFTYERLQRIFNCSFAYINYIIKNKIRR